MKKIIHTLIAASVLLFVSSCVKEIVEGGSSVSSGDEANVVLQLRTPGGFSVPKTRSLTFTDENTIDNIYVLVFNNKNELVEIKQGQSVSSTPGSSSPAYSGTGSFSVTLAASRTSLETYNLVVLANASTIISNTIGFNAR